jgi:hypothetical protein
MTPETRARMRDLGISVAVDNTPVVSEQPFTEPVEVTQDELQEDRDMFDKWLDATTIPRSEFEQWMKNELKRTDEILKRRVEMLTENR